jgi:broad specificity phosphatase PhoE
MMPTNGSNSVVVVYGLQQQQQSQLLSPSQVLASNGLSESAVQFVKQLSISQREKILAECSAAAAAGDGDGKAIRPIKIYAERLPVDDNNNPVLSPSSTTTTTDAVKYDEISATNAGTTITTKIVHFQRHGQGYHNILGDILRDVGIPVDIDSTDPKVNPWIRPEIVDSPLTENGKNQCTQQRVVASTLRPDLIVVSPLLRAIQTAIITFADYYGPHTTIPWIAHEGCREDLGVLTCNKRRPRSVIEAEYPSIIFHSSMTEEDTLWDPTTREDTPSKSERIYDFLTNFIATRPEHNIAVVGHSAWLFHMCNAVVDCGEDDDLASWFLTSEVRSMKLTFVKS